MWQGTGVRGFRSAMLVPVNEMHTLLQPVSPCTLSIQPQSSVQVRRITRYTYEAFLASGRDAGVALLAFGSQAHASLPLRRVAQDYEGRIRVGRVLVDAQVTRPKQPDRVAPPQVPTVTQNCDLDMGGWGVVGEEIEP